MLRRDQIGSEWVKTHSWQAVEVIFKTAIGPRPIPRWAQSQQRNGNRPGRDLDSREVSQQSRWHQIHSDALIYGSPPVYIHMQKNVIGRGESIGRITVIKT